MREDDLARTLIARQIHAEVVDLLFCKRMVRLHFDDGGGDFAEPFVRQADDGDVFDMVVLAEEVLDLDGIEVLAARDDDILLAVDKIDESVLRLLRHVACEEPSVLQDFARGLFILVIAFHDAVALEGQFADFAAFDRLVIFVDDFRLPAIACDADGADVVDVFNAEMDGARADGFAEAVVRVVVVMGEDLLPAFDEAGRHGLRADVHEPPLVKLVVGQFDFAAVDGVENVLRPWDEQPDNRALLFGDGADDPFRLYTF